MADKNIGSLPALPNLRDDSLMVVEQQGQAMKMTGAQFKDFGRQSVIEEVQDYVEEAKTAASEAAGAVSAVVDMNVEAHPAETASVEKSIQSGRVHLTFGLPRGEQGLPGQEGKPGPRGPKGDPGTGLKILGYYDTLAQLEAAQPDPEPGNAYGVGAEAPYDIYVYDGASGQWKNNGPLSGGGGTILPENAVTSQGGGTMEVAAELGDSPWNMKITDEEEPPLAAGDILTTEGDTVQEAIDGLFTSVSNGKAAVASAITDKGVPTPQDAAFSQMAENIGKITTGASTGDATATPGDILAPKTAYTAAGKVEGIIPTLGARTITPSTENQIVAAGQYLGGTQTILGDPNLTSGNIKAGVTLFGVEGAVEQSFLATLTVTVDVGAVVTAKRGDIEVSALCTTGQVTLELPAEGAWTVTATRGVAQYNSVVVTVSASYTASLTAEVHLEYFGTVTPLVEKRTLVTGASNANYAVFAGGYSNYGLHKVVDAYDSDLVHATPESLVDSASSPASATIENAKILFATSSIKVEGYTSELVRVECSRLNGEKISTVGTSAGKYGLFAGGKERAEANASYANSATVEAYDIDLTHSSPLPLGVAGSHIAAYNQSYGLFSSTSDRRITAYDKELSRSFPAIPERIFAKATTAGNYIVLAGGTSSSGFANAYDLFLTQADVQAPEVTAIEAALSLKDFALFITTDKIIVYDKFLTRTIMRREGTTYPKTPTNIGCASIGDYALLAGGVSTHTSQSGSVSKVYYDSVDAYHYV